MVSSRIGRNVFMDIDCENKFLEISRMPSYADIHKRAFYCLAYHKTFQNILLGYVVMI